MHLSFRDLSEVANKRKLSSTPHSMVLQSKDKCLYDYQRMRSRIFQFERILLTQLQSWGRSLTRVNTVKQHIVPGQSLQKGPLKEHASSHTRVLSKEI